MEKGDQFILNDEISDDSASVIISIESEDDKMEVEKDEKENIKVQISDENKFEEKI